MLNTHNKAPHRKLAANHLFRFANQLLPDNLKQKPEQEMRGHLLLGLLFASISSALVVIPWLVFSVAPPRETLYWMLYADIGCMLSYLACLAILLRGNFLLAANIYFIFLAAVNLIAVQTTGGFHESPLLYLSLFAPIFAFVLFGMRGGLIWLALIFAYAMASLFLSEAGLVTSQSLGEAMIQKMRTGMFFLLIFMGGTGLVFYERIHQELHKRLEEERDTFAYHAGHDMLTGLANRFQFFEFGERVLKHARQHNKPLVLFYMDLNGFKQINDQYGHHVGDEILQTIAERLREVTRSRDLAARFGGDEFVVLNTNLNDRGEARKIAERIVNRIQQPIEIDHRSHSVQTSIGIAFYPEDGVDLDALCRAADAGLYQAKSRGGGIYLSTELP